MCKNVGLVTGFGTVHLPNISTSDKTNKKLQNRFLSYGVVRWGHVGGL